MKETREAMTSGKVEKVLRTYFGSHLVRMEVTESVLCIHAHVMYNDFKTEFTVRRELMDKLPGVFIELERGYTGEVMLDAIYGIELEDQEIYVNGVGGTLKKTTVYEYLNDYLNGKELA
ncbi:MAG: hypothetical protein ACI4TW_02290 [Prevotella sp.]